MTNKQTHKHKEKERRRQDSQFALNQQKIYAREGDREGMKSARRIYKSSKSDLMPYSVHTVKSRSSSKKEKKNAETKMMHGKKSVSQFVSGKGMHTAGHTRGKAFAN